MCGLCGIYLRDPSVHVDSALIRRMRDTMVHRGPDAAGEYYHRGVGFGHRRLKVIDLSEAAAQPMSNPEGTITIIYNGEIYNFRELRMELEAHGYHFTSNGDAEVLLYLYEAEGPTMVRRLNGIFAFAIHDAREDILFCARDPLGVQPFYYALTSEGLLFASEGIAGSGDCAENKLGSDWGISHLSLCEWGAHILSKHSAFTTRSYSPDVPGRGGTAGELLLVSV